MSRWLDRFQNAWTKVKRNSMSSTAFQSLCVVLIFQSISFAQNSGAVLGLAKTKPAAGRYVETPQGFMVPYETKIPGTDVTYRMQPIPGGKVKVGSPEAEKGRQTPVIHGHSRSLENRR